MALKDHGPPNFSGLSELEGTAKQVENPEYSRKSQPAVQGVGKRQDSRDLTRETLLSAPEFERGLKFASILSQKPPSKVLEDVDQGLVNEFNRIPVTTWSLGLDTDGNADPRMTRECSQASSTADRALGTNGLRKSGALEQGPRARRLSRKDRGPLEQDYRGDEGSFTDTRKRYGTFFKSDSSNRPRDEAEDFDRGRRSIAIPSRLVKTAQLLKDWVSNKGNSKTLTAQQRLLDLQHRPLVAGAPIALIVLFVLHTTSGIPRCLMLLLTWIVWHSLARKD